MAERVEAFITLHHFFIHQIVVQSPICPTRKMAEFIQEWHIAIRYNIFVDILNNYVYGILFKLTQNYSRILIYTVYPRIFPYSVRV